jgi:hypothetical protein
MEYENEISQQDAGSPATNLPDRKNAKQNGELAELIFMGKAVSLGFGVAKPWGDSQRFDFILSRGERLWRVQVKSTTHVHRRGYKVGARKRSIQGQVAYTPKEIDILVAYIVPREVYYVIPAAAVQGVTTLHLFPSGARKGAGRFEQYREAWHLMMPAANPAPADPTPAESSLAEPGLAKDALE